MDDDTGPPVRPMARTSRRDFSVALATPLEDSARLASAIEYALLKRFRNVRLVVVLVRPLETA